jgi:hypothetical protein
MPAPSGGKKSQPGIDQTNNQDSSCACNPALIRQIIRIPVALACFAPDRESPDSPPMSKQFVVQTSSDLQSWNDVPDTNPNLILTDYSAGPPVVEASVKYTLPTGAPKSFVRLKVIPN